MDDFLRKFISRKWNLKGLTLSLIHISAVMGIPRGSGLGTSSILAGACVKAIFEYIGKEVTENELYTHVLCMEQLMSTGGGWQDQVGGLTGGIKLVSTKPVSYTHLDVYKRQELDNDRILLSDAAQ